MTLEQQKAVTLVSWRIWPVHDGQLGDLKDDHAVGDVAGGVGDGAGGGLREERGGADLPRRAPHPGCKWGEREIKIYARIKSLQVLRRGYQRGLITVHWVYGGAVCYNHRRLSHLSFDWVSYHSPAPPLVSIQAFTGTRFIDRAN